MSERFKVSRKFLVLSALALVVTLAGSLGLRVLGADAHADQQRATRRVEAPADSQSPGPPQVAHVSDPMPLDPLSIPVPNWYDRKRQEGPVAFIIDLDAIAPLGDGTSNAALWFRQFAKHDGARLADYEAAMGRRIEGEQFKGKVLPGDDPLLLEAEPWADQAIMRHYPDVWELDGYQTPITNLLAILTFARAWVERGNATDDADLAREDYRRAIRLGRLLRQEDTIVINDLVGLACIRYGLEGLYELEREQGNTAAAMLAGFALGEVAPQRLLTSSLITEGDKIRLVRSWYLVGNAVEVGDDELARVVDTATGHPNRRFRGEAMLNLHMVFAFGSGEPKRIAGETLERLAQDQDRLTAELARWCLEHEFDPKEYFGEH